MSDHTQLPPQAPPDQRLGGSLLRLMAVDDDPDEFALLENGFAQCGVTVELTTATTAAMAMAELQMVDPAERPSLALIDIGMPMIDGFELARQLIREGLPTILMSSHVDPARAAHARELGVLDLLAKPADGRGYQVFAARVLRIVGAVGKA